MQLYPKDYSLSRFLKSIALLVGCIGSMVTLFVSFLGWCTYMPGDPDAVQDVAADTVLVQRLETHVRTIAVPRNDTHEKGYDEVEAYIRTELEKMGYDVRTQDVKTNRRTSRNLVVEVPGVEPGVIIVGAHYDSHFETPGADDNASGSAVTLELARLMVGKKPQKTIRFIFFANEEPPYFRTEFMGSDVAAESAKIEGKVELMYSMEMLGYFDDTPGSQKYPPVLDWFYPDTGNFIAFVGNIDHRGPTTDAVAAFREKATIPAYGFAGPDWVKGIDFSDHMPFWNRDIPAVMVTDTSFFRNPHYHKLTDTPDTLDYERMGRIVESFAPLLI